MDLLTEQDEDYWECCYSHCRTGINISVIFADHLSASPTLTTRQNIRLIEKRKQRLKQTKS